MSIMLCPRCKHRECNGFVKNFLPQASELIMRLILILLATTAAATSTCAVVLGYNRCADALNFLVLLLDLLGICLWIRVQPRLTILESIHDLLLFLVGKLLGFFDHLLDLLLRQAALVVGDGDLLT